MPDVFHSQCEGLAGLELKTGVGVDASALAHPEANLVCVDATAFVPLSLGMSSDSVVGKVLEAFDLELSYDIFDSDNSPVKLNFHIENFAIVDECTYGNGAIEVVVKNDRGQVLKSAKVTIEDSNETVHELLFTDANGKAKLEGISAGSYKVYVRATGYKKYYSREVVKTNETTYMEAVLMVGRDEGDDDTDAGVGCNFVTGNVTNAVTGLNIDASFKVRKGMNSNETDEVVAEGVSADGKYKIALPIGYYTITFSKDGYYNSSVNVVVNTYSQTVKNVVLSPELGDVDLGDGFRVVLTWGEYPYDLDSHIMSTSDSQYHIYYSSQDYYNDGEHIANLDVDDTSSYGPETTTVYKVSDDDKFSFYVHDYSNRYEGSSTEMSESGAKVQLYSGDALIAVYNIPIGQSGTLWHVFDYDPSNNSLSAVNTFADVVDHKSYFIDQY